MIQKICHQTVGEFVALIALASDLDHERLATLGDPAAGVGARAGRAPRASPRKQRTRSDIGLGSDSGHDKHWPATVENRLLGELWGHRLGVVGLAEDDEIVGASQIHETTALSASLPRLRSKKPTRSASVLVADSEAARDISSAPIYFGLGQLATDPTVLAAAFSANTPVSSAPARSAILTASASRTAVRVFE